MTPVELSALKILVAGILTMLSSQILKFAIYSIKKRKLVPHYLFALGGMPSSHTATAVALSSSIYFAEGLTPLFVATIFLVVMVVMDVLISRWPVEQHSKAINSMLKQFKIKSEQMKEVKAHKWDEVIAGAVYGFLIAVLVFRGIV